MTKEQFIILEEYIKTLIDVKLLESYPATGDVKKAEEKLVALKTQVFKILTNCNNDLK